MHEDKPTENGSKYEYAKTSKRLKLLEFGIEKLINSTMMKMIKIFEVVCIEAKFQKLYRMEEEKEETVKFDELNKIDTR